MVEEAVENGPEWAGPPATIAELEDRLAQVGLSRHAEALARLARTSIRLVPDKAVDVEALGTTRLGGDPDLPPEVPWPHLGDRPLSFIAQINLAALPRTPASADLPDRGLLSFYYDAVRMPWGYDPTHRGSWAVRYCPDDGSWQRRPAPADLPEDVRFKPLGLAGEPELCFAPSESHDVMQVDAELPWSPYHSVLGWREETLHRLLGHPDLIQEDMQRECQLVSNGIYCGNPKYRSDPRVEPLLAGAGDWRLLLQVDSTDRETGMMWGDLGRLYYWIRDEDLRDRAWDRTWLVLQCG